jgi:glycosyltransferase involved in cell wall biosynthesis
VRDLVCFSHLRWAFVLQRPQHLMARAARKRRVWFVEEPVPGPRPLLRCRVTPEGVRVCVPEVPAGLGIDGAETVVTGLVADLARAEGLRGAAAWLYTPMMLPFAEALDPSLVVYDCMDELAAFRAAPPEILYRERALFARADLVFVGGPSLWEAKRGAHAHLHLFRSSVDVSHFRVARSNPPEPATLAPLRRPRLGWVGVIDERMDLALLGQVAALRPDWEWPMIGPVVKIDAGSVPQAPNVHLLGTREYRELPAYLAHFDVAIMPFARNDATRFISPTKTPEYLAAGLPVVSTAVRDVVHDYADRGLVHIAADAPGFVAACERALTERHDPARQEKVDAVLAESSWDDTWMRMDRLLETAELRTLVRSAK